MRLIDLTGEKFGRLTVIKRHPVNDRQNKPQWECICDCGKNVVVSAYSLRSGNTKSCGCYKSDIDREVNTTHGESKTRLYRIWCSIKRRCNSPTDKSYDRYGGRGISVCEEWNNSYETFSKWAKENGYSEGLSIERKDVNGNYCPDNCTWITLKEQARNKRNTIYITIGNETKRFREWCEMYNVKYDSALYRYHKGYSVEEIFRERE